MTDEIADLVKKAAEAAKAAPKHLQEAAFNRAFEALYAQAGAGPVPRAHKRTSHQPARSANIDQTPEDLLSALDRTAHPDINHNEPVLLNALRLLKAAKDDAAVDGLSASTVAKLLIDKFRCRLSRRGVAEALNNAGRYVNRHQVGSSVIFRIMGPGEEYLASRIQEKATQSDLKVASGRKAATKKQRSTNDKAGKGKKRATGGPASAMTKLLDAGYFSTSRTIGDITGKLRHDHGRLFKANEISPVLVRWLRGEKLSRRQNSDGQYEYTAT